MDVLNTFETIKRDEEKYLDFLCDICAFEGKAKDKEAIDEMITFISEFAQKEGFLVTRTEFTECGDFLSVDLNEGAEKGCVFMAHTDTVHEKGLFGEDSVKRLEDRIIAPGVMSFMSVWAKYIEVDFLGDALLAGKSTKIEWLKPVFADDVLTGKATITNLVKRSEKNGLVEVTIEAYNQNGELVLTDVTEAIVKCRMP